MAYTSADLENVERAIIALSTGAKATRFVVDGDVVEYSVVELPQLRSLLSEIVAELAALADDGSAVSAFIVTGGKGL